MACDLPLRQATPWPAPTNWNIGWATPLSAAHACPSGRTHPPSLDGVGCLGVSSTACLVWVDNQTSSGKRLVRGCDWPLPHSLGCQHSQTAGYSQLPITSKSTTLDVKRRTVRRGEACRGYFVHPPVSAYGCLVNMLRSGATAQQIGAEIGAHVPCGQHRDAPMTSWTSCPTPRLRMA